MEKINVIILPKAKNDIENILIYLLNENIWKSLVIKIKNLIYSWIFGLEYFPEKCPIYFENYRRLLIKSYSIYYEIDEINKKVIIYRVLHQAQNYEKYLD